MEFFESCFPCYGKNISVYLFSEFVKRGKCLKFWYIGYINMVAWFLIVDG